MVVTSGVRRRLFDRLDRGEDLGQAGHRHLLIGAALGEDFAGVGIDHDVEARSDLEIKLLLGVDLGRREEYPAR